jgi:hypothetical protein
MRRHAVALFFILGCLLAGSLSIQAAEVRFPKTGPNAFVINVLSGWETKEDQFNGLQLLPKDRWAAVYLSMALDKEYAGRPLKDLALAIGKPSNITEFPKQEPTTLSGKKGEAFYGLMKNDKGLLLDVKMIIIPLGSDLWATETILTAKGLSDAQRKSLDQAVRGVKLSTVK